MRNPFISGGSGADSTSFFRSEVVLGGAADGGGGYEQVAA